MFWRARSVRSSTRGCSGRRAENRLAPALPINGRDRREERADAELDDLPEEHRATGGGESLDQRDSLKNVFKIKLVALAHSGRASARMRALSFG